MGQAKIRRDRGLGHLTVDQANYPSGWFAKLYLKRWAAEEDYKREKQRLGIENYSGRWPLILLQDFHAKIFAQNLKAIFVFLAQWLADERYREVKYVYRINFANALSKMRNNIIRLFLHTSPTVLYWRILKNMALAVERVRPDGSCPRDMKKVRVPACAGNY